MRFCLVVVSLYAELDLLITSVAHLRESRVRIANEVAGSGRRSYRSRSRASCSGRELSSKLSGVENKGRIDGEWFVGWIRRSHCDTLDGGVTNGQGAASGRDAENSDRGDGRNYFFRGWRTCEMMQVVGFRAQRGNGGWGAGRGQLRSWEGTRVTVRGEGRGSED